LLLSSQDQCLHNLSLRVLFHLLEVFVVRQEKYCFYEFLLFENPGAALVRKFLKIGKLLRSVEEIINISNAVFEGRLDEFVLFQTELYHIEKFQAIERFGDIVVGSHVHADSEIPQIRLGREKDKGDVRCVGILAQQVQDAITIQAGHHNVAQDQVGLTFLCQLDACLPCIAQRDIVAAEFENGRNVLAHFDIVFND